MVDQDDILHYKISIEMVLKDLRMEKGISQGKKKGISQSDVNIDFANNYNITLNMGRVESDPNFTLTNLFLICRYFGITISDFFQRVEQKNEKEIKVFLARKLKKRKKIEAQRDRKA